MALVDSKEDSPDEEDKDEPSQEASFTPAGVLFYVNKDGLPLSSRTSQRMWDHCSRIHPDGEKMVSKIKNSSNLPKIPVPQPPSFQPTTPVPVRLEAVQNYMKQLQYNHTGMQFFEVKKNRPLSGILEVAKEMLRESLPIKCLEAVILAIFLTNGSIGLQRFPIGFKTAFNGNIHRHVVLGVYYSGCYGALGMSRRDDLMYKPLKYQSLTELVDEFEEVYKKYYHRLKRVKIGNVVSHDPHSIEQIQWKGLSLNMVKMNRTSIEKEIEKFAKELKSRSKYSSYQMTTYQHVTEANPYASTSPRKDNTATMYGLQQRSFSPAVVFMSRDNGNDSD